MKKLMLLTVAIGIAAMAAGCQRLHQVSGSGNRQTQKREVASFLSISSEGPFEINVVCKQPLSLEIEGDDNILPLVSTEVSNNVLYIKSTQSYSVSKFIKLKITVPDLAGISVEGAGLVEVAGLKNEKFEIDANGAPTIRAFGETKLVEIDANGAGKIDTSKLRALKAVVDSKGVSSVDVRAVDKLDVTVSGPSHVTYEGNPVVNRTIHGPGSIEKKWASGA